jgi:23S rRNA C2498 (ribose-2'-O)-methylase RlmM
VVGLGLDLAAHDVARAPRVAVDVPRGPRARRGRGRIEERGARVVAVDRARLDPKIVARAGDRLTHVRADAFTYVPERRPTWLVCDVIAEPVRSLDVARRALESRVLNGLVVTLKLKRPVDLAILAAARAVAMRTPGFFGRCKNLVANKLEVTLMMKRAL